MGEGVVAGGMSTQGWKLLSLSTDIKGGSQVCQDLSHSASIAPGVKWAGSWKLLLGPQHPRSTCPLDSITQTVQQHYKLRGPQSVVTHPPLVSLLASLLQ